MRTSETITKLAPALAKAQAEIQDPEMSGEGQVGGKTSQARRYPYALLVDVLKVARTALGGHGIMFTQAPDMIEGRHVLVTRLIHSSGEWLEADYPMPPPNNDPQRQGSANTYARRYALMSVLGIAGELDDDGAGAKGAKAQAADEAHSAGVKDGRRWLVSQLLVGAARGYHGPSFARAVSEAGIPHSLDHIKMWCLWLGKDKPSRMNAGQRDALVGFLASERGAESWARFAKECGPLRRRKPGAKKAQEKAQEAPGGAEGAQDAPEGPEGAQGAPEASWSAEEREAYLQRLAELDWSPEEIRSWCLAHDRPEPANMPEAQRIKLLDWLVADVDKDGRKMNGGDVVLAWLEAEGGKNEK